MAIQSGTHLGPYEIVSAIGAGGMGEVYRAHDPKLGRDVAIKVLPEVFAGDAARMARFQREAKVLASLSHPNIATIYGLEDSATTRALVMELVEGPTLADRIKQGPIPVDEAVRIARQIADALEYAHERGIIHRDLKPANIKVAPDDTVKILDFGLAKALEGDPSSIDISISPTISRMATQAGVLLGTAAYMSPEQAKAKPVDRRADIWAFGCVQYEMLTSKQAFTGETVTDTLAAVIKEEPDWKALPAATPMRVRVLLQRCLQKDVRQRLQAIGDARISLDEVLSGAPEAAPGVTSAAPTWRSGLPWALFGATAIAFAVFAWAPWRAATTTEPVRFQVPLPEKITLGFASEFEVSPNGEVLAFAAVGSDGVQRMWVRPLDSLEARPLPGSESPIFQPIFWSADSRYVAFNAGGKLKKIPISGGPAETICDLAGPAGGGSWNSDGVIIFGQGFSGGLMRVPAAGGVPSPLTAPDTSHGESDILPSFLPDGRHFVYLRTSNTLANSGIYIGSLDARPEQQSSKPLLATQYQPVYVPSSAADSGHLLFVRDRALLAQPFDARRLALAGDAVTLADGLGSYGWRAWFSASTNGVLVYRAGGTVSQQLTWYDRQGTALGTAGEPALFFGSDELSPDGTRAALSEPYLPRMSSAVWLLDLTRGTSTRFTFGSVEDIAESPVWSPDGNRIIFASNREGHFDLYQKSASGVGDEELLLKSNENKYPSSWSRDGRFLLYTAVDPKTKSDLWVLPLLGNKKPFPFLQTEFNEVKGRFSPDGHWVAYMSDESGRFEVYVRPFSPGSGEATSGAGGKWLTSTNGGVLPRWRGDGRELYYIASDGRLMAVEVSTNSTFHAGLPKVLFQEPLPIGLAINVSRDWDVTADGKRFLFPALTAQAAQTPFTVVLNWQSLLKK